jgi:protein SCO1
MNNPFRLSLLGLALALAGCNVASPPPEGNLVGARIGAPFTLVDQDGKPRRWDDFSGQYRLVYFGYTFCPDICPLDLKKIGDGLRLFEKSDPALAAKVQPIFITVDPTRDTSAVMKQYVPNFHPRLIGLTGTETEIEVVKRAFVVVASKVGDQKATKDYLVSHTQTPFLFGPDGKPIALVPVDRPDTKEDDGSPEAIRDLLATYVR